MNRFIQLVGGKWVFWISISLGLHWWGVGSLVSVSEETVSVQVETGPVPLSTFITPPPPPEEVAPTPPAASPEPFLTADQSEKEVYAEAELRKSVREVEQEVHESEQEPEKETEVTDLPEEKTPPPDRPEPPPVPEPPVEVAETESEPIPMEAPPPPENTGALSEETPEALVSPAPHYPRIAVRRGLEGTVVLKVALNEDGSPADVRVAQSSGYALLDREAQDTVLRKWRFKSRPSLKKSFQVEIEFRLDQG